MDSLAHPLPRSESGLSRKTPPPVIQQRTSPGGYQRPRPQDSHVIHYPAQPGARKFSQNSARSALDAPSRPLPPAPLPPVRSSDDLAVASDGTLHGLWRSLKDEAVRYAREGYDVRPWETELSYVQRELRIRDGRAEAFQAARASQDGQALDGYARDSVWGMDDPSLPEYQPTPPPREWFRYSAVAKRLAERFNQ